MDLAELNITESHHQRAKAVLSLWKTINEEYELGCDFAASLLAFSDKREVSSGTKYDYTRIVGAFLAYERCLYISSFWRDFTKAEPRTLAFSLDTFREAVRLAHLENENIYFTDFFTGVDCSSAAPILAKYKELMMSSTTA